MTASTALADGALLAGRALFGGVLALVGLPHLVAVDEMAGDAVEAGVPAPSVAVVLSGILLVAGGLGVVVGAFPTLAAGGLVAFFVVTTPTMHAFWRFDGEERERELSHFPKNVALPGAALAFLALGPGSWEYALRVGP